MADDELTAAFLNAQQLIKIDDATQRMLPIPWGDHKRLVELCLQIGERPENTVADGALLLLACTTMAVTSTIMVDYGPIGNALCVANWRQADHDYHALAAL